MERLQSVLLCQECQQVSERDSHQRPQPRIDWIGNPPSSPEFGAPWRRGQPFRLDQDLRRSVNIVRGPQSRQSLAPQQSSDVNLVFWFAQDPPRERCSVAVGLGHRGIAVGSLSGWHEIIADQAAGLFESPR